MNARRGGGLRNVARFIAAMLCAIALGSLLFSARMAPLVFEALPNDRALAGFVTGRAFESAYWFAAVASVVALVVAASARSTRAGVECALATVMALASALELGWLVPAIARHGSGWPWSFASLHRAGGATHLVLALLALGLAWMLVSRGARG